ncbi:hypothetical protein Q0Z83_037120 [Actinoplanes sichuanensis]|nr:hypothetical protein Q0Z83_037120 [Actinoplanes sichuanensis]
MQQVSSVNVDWRASSFCDHINCVEVAVIGGAIAVRNSKDRSGTVQMYSPEEWTAFLDGITNGDFDFSS